MAEALESFSFKSTQGGHSQWSQFMDGQAWKITLGVDIRAKTLSSARNGAIGHATRHGMKVRTSKVSNTEIVVQFYKTEEDQRNGSTSSSA